jgi:uncharacterized membrane protein
MADPSSSRDKPGVQIGDHVPSGSELTTAMVHIYRGELGRSNVWRTRLDATTNWAVVTAGAAITFAFGTPEHSHVVLLLVAALVLLFLFIEARRYRYYELWTHRVRMMETHFFSNLFRPEGEDDEGWQQRLVDSLRRPRFPISLMEALGRRYRRTYALLFLILAGSWLLKVFIHPKAASSLSQVLRQAAAGPIPGWLVIVGWLLFNIALVAMGLSTVGLRESESEVFGRAPRVYLRLVARLRAVAREALEVDLAAIRPPFVGTSKHLAWIISDRAEPIADVLLKELDRGVTRIRGEGMYSGQEHAVLLCVVTGRQVERLKTMVRDADPQAFVVITAAREVRGEGFRPFEV